MYNHNFLTSNFPSTVTEREKLHHRLEQGDDGVSMDPSELADLNEVVGEDIEDEKEDAAADDCAEPTESQ
eukprot:5397611-Karenia_brevis.AAC.1